MTAPFGGYNVILKLVAMNLIFELLESSDRGGDPEVQKAIHDSVKTDLRDELLKDISARYDKSIYDRYVLTARATLDRKADKLLTTQSIEKMIDLSQQIGRKLQDWRDQVNDDDQKRSTGRKRKLDEIENKAEEMVNIAKKLREK